MDRIQFKKIKVIPEVFDRLAKATERLNQLTGDHFFIVTFLLGKVLAFEIDNLVLVVVSNRSRPSRSTVVGLIQGDRALLPSQTQEDFTELRRMLGAETDEDTDQVKKWCSHRGAVDERDWENAAEGAVDAGPAAVHPGKAAADAIEANKASVTRALRQADTPQARGVAQLMKRGKLDVDFLATGA